MSSTADFYQETVEITRGDRYSRNLEVEIPTVDFSGAVVEIQIREKPSSALLHDASADATLVTSTVGEMTIVITLPGDVTDTLPDRCTLDVRISKAAISLGPLTVLRLHLRLSDSHISED
jgi:hypothetical protein